MSERFLAIQKRAEELKGMTDRETRTVYANLKAEVYKKRRIEKILKLEFGEES